MNRPAKSATIIAFLFSLLIVAEWESVAVGDLFVAKRWGVRGFSSAGQFSQARTELAEALHKPGLKVRQSGVRGSVVTDVSSKGGGFRVGAENGLKPSDIDVFIEFADDIGLSSSQEIPGFIHPDKLLKNYPALREWSEKWSKILGREITPGGFKPGTFNDPDVIGF